MLQETLLRLAPLSDSITVVTGDNHKVGVCDQVKRLQDEDLLGGTVIHLVLEPSGKDSMPAIGLATALIERRYGRDATIGSFAADHVIEDERAFAQAVVKARQAAAEGYLVTVGIEPTGPSAAFGYIQPSANEVAPGCYLVERFVEKPSPKVAERYLAEGYKWNAGMFVFEAGWLMDAVGELHPAMHQTLRELASLWGPLATCGDHVFSPARGVLELWEGVRPIAIDHALAEPLASAGSVAMVPAPRSMGWSDVGDFTALESVSQKTPEPVLLGSEGALVFGEGRQVVVLGIPDAIVVDTGDAILVTTKSHAQRVKDAVGSLRSRGSTDYL